MWIFKSFIRFLKPSWMGIWDFFLKAFTTEKRHGFDIKSFYLKRYSEEKNANKFTNDFCNKKKLILRAFYFVLVLFLFITRRLMRVSQFLGVSCKGCSWPIKGAIPENLHMPSMNKHHCNASHHIWRPFVNKTVAWQKSIAYACKWIASRSVTRSISGQTFSAGSCSKHTRFSDDKSKLIWKI